MNLRCLQANNDKIIIILTTSSKSSLPTTSCSLHVLNLDKDCELAVLAIFVVVFLIMYTDTYLIINLGQK